MRNALMLMLIVLLSISISQAWWNNNWQYRIRADTNSNVELTDYTLYVSIDTSSLISQGKMRPDCYDIRVVDTDDMTQLNYWIEEKTCNTPNTIIWFRSPHIPVGQHYVYIYYGNHLTTSQENPDAIFYRFDDFNSGLRPTWDNVFNVITQNGEAVLGSDYGWANLEWNNVYGNRHIRSRGYVEGTYYKHLNFITDTQSVMVGSEPCSGNQYSFRVVYNPYGDTIICNPTTYQLSNYIITDTYIYNCNNGLCSTSFYINGTYVESYNIEEETYNIGFEKAITEGNTEVIKVDYVLVRDYNPDEPSYTLSSEEQNPTTTTTTTTTTPITTTTVKPRTEQVILNSTVPLLLSLGVLIFISSVAFQDISLNKEGLVKIIFIVISIIIVLAIFMIGF